MDEGSDRQPSHRAAAAGTGGPDDTALFQYSGGTTGVSKGAVALHRNVVANTLQLKAWFVVMEDGKEVLLMAIPLFHVYGMVAGMLNAIALGATMVMIPNAAISQIYWRTSINTGPRSSPVCRHFTTPSTITRM